MTTATWIFFSAVALATAWGLYRLAGGLWLTFGCRAFGHRYEVWLANGPPDELMYSCTRCGKVVSAP